MVSLLWYKSEANTTLCTRGLGGSPYTDLVKGFDYVVKTYPFLDERRAIAAGASYGGYMVNWIQGHDFGRKFKALVCHDGIFSTLNLYASEELWFPHHDVRHRPVVSVLFFSFFFLNWQVLTNGLVQWDHLGKQRNLREVGPCTPSSQVGDAATSYPQRDGLPPPHIRGPSGIQRPTGQGDP